MVLLRVDALITGTSRIGRLLLSAVLGVQVRREALLGRIVLQQALILLHLHVELLQIAEVFEVELEVLDLLRGQLLAHLQVEILPHEAHRHYRFGDACEAQLLTVDCAWVRHEDGHWHFLGLHFVLRQFELEHVALVAEVDLLLFHLVGEWNARDERPRRLRLDVQEEVAFGIEADVLLPRVVVGVEGVHEQDFVPDLAIAGQAEVEVDLPVVFPDFALLVRLLQLIVVLGLGFLLFFLALGG